MFSFSRCTATANWHGMHKTQCWALQSTELIFTVIHVLGESNSCNDILFQWVWERFASGRHIPIFPIQMIFEKYQEVSSTEVMVALQ